MIRKKVQPIVILAILTIFFVVSCTPVKPVHNKPLSSSLDGKTPAKAVQLVPGIGKKTTGNFTITVNDNIRWLKVSMQKGKTYYFETVGTGDPSLRVYKASQVKSNGDYSGEPITTDNDSAPDNNNAMLKYRAGSSGTHYVMIILYAGSKWQGGLAYSVK